jgi:hypothetical protein
MSKPTLYTGPAITVTFEDHGQDFLEWDIASGVVVGCRPFQAGIWCGHEIYGTPKQGECIQFMNSRNETTCIKYPIAKVVETKPAQRRGAA